jgi:hypothetical protein
LYQTTPVKGQRKKRKLKLFKMESGLYKHYKGNIYEVIGVAKHSETLEPMVVYKATYQPEEQNLWVRPLAMFTENVMVEGIEVKRFEKI